MKFVIHKQFPKKTFCKNLPKTAKVLRATEVLIISCHSHKTIICWFLCKDDGFTPISISENSR